MNMRVRHDLLAALAVAFLFAGGGSAQPADSASAAAESLAKWQWYQDLKPVTGTPKYVDFLVMPGVFDKARAELADLLVRDTNNQEVKYALRIRRDENRQEQVKAEEFNHTRLGDRSDQLYLDLGDKQVSHNELLIRTTGSNFRRVARIEGSDRRDADWKVLTDHAPLIDFRVGSQTLHEWRVQYPTSRFRYLRVRVFPDGGIEDDKPTITSVTVYQSTRVPGEELTMSAELGMREPVKTDEGPGSAWIIDLGGDNVPVSKLRFQIDDNDFVRDYRLEVMAEQATPRDTYNRRDFGRRVPVKEPYYYPNDGRYMPTGGVVASGQWRRRAGTPRVPLEISFNEVYAHRLRLSVTDNRNPPLNIKSAEFSAAARQVILDGSGAKAGPLRVYFGNPAAQSPNYDFARNLPDTLAPAPERTQLEGAAVLNPNYQPEPPPWTERWPWLIYVVLGIASLTLIAILGVLAREAMRRHDATAPAAPDAAPAAG
jgi:hypothetical protein